MVTDNRTLDAGCLTSKRVFLSHGVSIGVRSNDPALLERVQDCFPPGWQESSSAAAAAWYSILRVPVDGKSARYRLYQDEKQLEEGFRFQRLLDAMDSEIRLQVGQRSRERLFVHAGAVGWKDRAILLPGRSGTGKTTLVAALIEAGASYFSDEYAVLDTDGFLHPYARFLSFRHGSSSARRFRRCPVDDLGGQQAEEPLRVGLVVHTRYRVGACWEPRVLSSGEGALALFGNALAARELPDFAFSVLSGAVTNAICLGGDRGEAEAAASAILDFADSCQTTITGETA